MSNSLAVRVAMAASAVLLIAGIVAYSYFVEGIRMLSKYAPDWSPSGLARTGICLLAAGLLVTALRPHARQRRPLEWSQTPFATIAAMTGIAAMAIAASLIAYQPRIVMESVWEGTFLSIATNVVFTFALGVLAVCAWRSRSMTAPRVLGLRPVIVLGLIISVVFLILMEEMSWGQHMLGFGTPDNFAANEQKETNLHNFYTYRFEAAYYSAAVAAFVLLPFAWPARPPRFLEGASLYVPPRAFALVALPLCGFFFMTWNYAINQLWFFAGLIIAVDFMITSRQRAHRILAAVVAMAMILSQIAYLRFGYQLTLGPRDYNGHELTEIREFMITLAILAYSVLLAGRFSAAPKTSAVTDHASAVSVEA